MLAMLQNVLSIFSRYYSYYLQHENENLKMLLNFTSHVFLTNEATDN